MSDNNYKPSCSDDPAEDLHDHATNLDDLNDHLSLHNWIDNSVELEPATERNQNQANGQNTFEQQIAVGLTRVVMEGMPLDENSDEIDNAEMTRTINRVTQDPDLQIPDDQVELFGRIATNMNQLTTRYNDDERFKDILIRIRNFIRTNGGVSKDNPGGDMKKIIYHGISLLFGQIRNVLGRQQDFTTTNATHLLLTLREVFATIRRQNNLQPSQLRMSILSLVMEFVRVLWHKFVEFLKNTELGKWVTWFIWRQYTFTARNLMKGAAFGAMMYICWRYWDKNNGAS